MPPQSSLDVLFILAQPIEHIMCPSCKSICFGVDTDANKDGLTSHSCTHCGSGCHHSSIVEDVALTEDLMTMVFFEEQTWVCLFVF